MKKTLIAALALVVMTTAAFAATSLDPAVRNARIQLDNAQTQLQNLTNQRQNLTTTQTNDKRIQADNTAWLAAEPAKDQQANDDLNAQKSTKPGLVDKLKSLTDTDDSRAKTLKSSQDAVTASKTKIAKLHDDAFAAFIAVDPGKTSYAPVKAAKEKLAKATAACLATLEKSADYRETAAAQKDAETQLVALRKGTDLAAVARASQEDMTLSNKIQKMRSTATDADPAVAAAAKELDDANLAFKPTMDKFEADLATQPDYAAAVQEGKDAQNALTTALAAQKQAGDDERGLRKQIADLDAKAAAASQKLKTSAAETARRTAQNATIDNELQNLTTQITNLDVQINNARTNVNQNQANYQSLLAQQRRAGG